MRSFADGLIEPYVGSVEIVNIERIPEFGHDERGRLRSTQKFTHHDISWLAEEIGCYRRFESVNLWSIFRGEIIFTDSPDTTPRTFLEAIRGFPQGGRQRIGLITGDCKYKGNNAAVKATWDFSKGSSTFHFDILRRWWFG